MSRKHSELKAYCLLTAIVISLVSYAVSVGVVSVEAAASYTGTAKPMEFYLHYLDTPVNVAGIQSKYVINSTQWFRFQTQQEAYANSFYKSIGQPKIAVDFYLYPN